MLNGKKISVILPAFNEEENILKAIEDFSLPFVDELIIVDNNSSDNTARIIKSSGKAILIQEKKQGYGQALQAGYNAASGDYLITAEPDGTFLGRDTLKLLAYAEDFEVVFGTRTNRTLVWQGANMDFLLLVGNWLVAKIMEVLFNTPTLSDMGCTMKLISRGAFLKIKENFKVVDAHFSAELMLEVIVNRLNFIEIPVNYKARVGYSKITGKKIKALQVGLAMIALVFKYRLKTLFQRRGK